MVDGKSKTLENFQKMDFYQYTVFLNTYYFLKSKIASNHLFNSLAKTNLLISEN